MSILSKELFTFVEVARWGSVRAAAERLNISASALSRQLRILENDIGVQLFIRNSNGVEITAPGRRLLQNVEKMIALETELRGELSASTGPRQLSIRLGLAECISTALVRRAHAHFSSIGKEVRLDICVAGTDQLVAHLIDGNLDAVVAFNMTTDERLRILKVFEVQVGLVCPRGLMPDPPTSIALADCLRWPLCLPDDALSIRPRLMAEINRQDRSYKIAATSNSIATTCGLIIEGAGVGFMTLADVVAQPEAEKLLFIPLKDRRLTEHISFAVSSSFTFEEGLGTSLLAIGTFISDITEGRSGVPVERFVN